MGNITVSIIVQAVYNVHLDREDWVGSRVMHSSKCLPAIIIAEYESEGYQCTTVFEFYVVIRFSNYDSIHSS